MEHIELHGVKQASSARAMSLTRSGICDIAHENMLLVLFRVDSLSVYRCCDTAVVDAT